MALNLHIYKRNGDGIKQKDNKKPYIGQHMPDSNHLTAKIEELNMVINK